MGWKGVGWIHLAHDRVQSQAPVNMVINLRLPKKTENFSTSFATISFSKKKKPLLYAVRS
jgi:hypothetical protein